MAQMRGGHIGVHQHRDREAAEGRAPQLFGESNGAECVERGTAIFLRMTDPEKAMFAHFAQYLARHETVDFPLVGERLHFVVDEAAQRIAQHFVLFTEIKRRSRR